MLFSNTHTHSPITHTHTHSHAHSQTTLDCGGIMLLTEICDLGSVYDFYGKGGKRFCKSTAWRLGRECALGFDEVRGRGRGRGRGCGRERVRGIVSARESAREIARERRRESARVMSFIMSCHSSCHVIHRTRIPILILYV